MSQRDAFGIPINPNKSYGEQYSENAMSEGGVFLESHGSGYAENMGAGGNLRRQGKQTENITDRNLESERYGSERRDDDMYGIGIGGGDRHHTPGDLETVPGVDSVRQDDEDLRGRDSNTGHQQQQQKQTHQQQDKGDSMLGKVMEKTGEILGNKKLAEQGREKRDPQKIYRDRD